MSQLSIPRHVSSSDFEKQCGMYICYMGVLGIGFNRRPMTKEEQASLVVSGWGSSGAGLKYIREQGNKEVGSDNVSTESFFFLGRFP